MNRSLATTSDSETGAVAFLASDDAAFVTDQALVLDGGLYKSSQPDLCKQKCDREYSRASA